MASKTKIRTVDRSEFKAYFSRAEKYYFGIEKAISDQNWDFVCTMSIRCAIFASDAITIKFGGVRSIEPDHRQAAKILIQTVKIKEAQAKVRHLKEILERKNLFEYTGVIPTEKNQKKNKQRKIKIKEKEQATRCSVPPKQTRTK